MPFGDLRYKAFGETRFPSGASTLPTNLRFTGQREEPDLGLYFYGARWYDPSIMMFVSPDTLIPDPYNPLDWNRYLYARANPLRYNDPSGHAVQDANDGGAYDPGSDDEEYLDYWRRSIKMPDLPEPIPLKSSTWSPPSIPPLCVPNPRPNSGLWSTTSDYELGPYRVVVQWDKVDWADVAISGVGIVGDVSLASTPVSNALGPSAYAVSEFVELVGAAGNLKNAYGFLTEGDVTGFIIEGGKGVSKDLGLIPAIGWGFDMVSILINIGEVTYIIPSYQKKGPPIYFNPPGNQ